MLRFQELINKIESEGYKIESETYQSTVVFALTLPSGSKVKARASVNSLLSKTLAVKELLQLARLAELLAV